MTAEHTISRRLLDLADSLQCRQIGTPEDRDHIRTLAREVHDDLEPASFLARGYDAAANGKPCTPPWSARNDDPCVLAYLEGYDLAEHDLMSRSR